MKYSIYRDFVVLCSRKRVPKLRVVAWRTAGDVCSKLESFLSHFSSKEYERDILKHDWTSWALKGFWQLFNSSSTPNPCISSLFAQNNGSVENAPNVIPIPFTSSLQEKSISLSNPTSTSISSKSKRKKPESASTNSTTPTPTTSSRIRWKLWGGKRDVTDWGKKSFVGIQDSGPSSSPSSKATWPIPASNSATNHHGDDEDWHGGDEQGDMTTTTIPTVAAAAPDTPPGPRHNQTPNPYVVGAKTLIMADPKNRADEQFFGCWLFFFEVIVIFIVLLIFLSNSISIYDRSCCCCSWC
ncbi:hypothetical protein BYT27DRAFT_6784000 [Phlegmacium glaucopus]|nr:hypothetical protein BYT27DRAFT_6784000 [Phlegmacium glaucopus]